MPTIRKSISIQASPETVYRYLADPAHMPEWISAIEDVRNVEDTGVGQRYEWTFRMAGVRLSGETRVIADQPERLRKTQTAGGIDSLWTFELRPEGKDTRLRLTITYTIPVPVLGKLAENLVAKRNDREAQVSLEHLRDIVEAEEQKRRAAE